MERIQTNPALSVLEKSAELYSGEGEGGLLRDINQRARLKQVAQAKRPGFSLPYALLHSPEIAKGMKELDNFGFHTTTVLMDPSGASMLSVRIKKHGGFHVSDLWSHKQQQEFLKRLRLERAQYARERQISFVNYLIENKKKLGKPLDLELLSSKNIQVVDPEIHRICSTSRVRMSQRAATTASARSRQEHLLVHEFSLPKAHTQSTLRPMNTRNSKRRLKQVEGLIVQCNDTLSTFRKDMKELAQSTKSLGSKDEITFEKASMLQRMSTKSFSFRQKY